MTIPQQSVHGIGDTILVPTRLGAKKKDLNWKNVLKATCRTSSEAKAKAQKAICHQCQAHPEFIWHILFSKYHFCGSQPPKKNSYIIYPWNWFLLVCVVSNKIRITFQWHINFNLRQMICPNLIIKQLRCTVKGKQ